MGWFGGYSTGSVFRGFNPFGNEKAEVRVSQEELAKTSRLFDGGVVNSRNHLSNSYAELCRLENSVSNIKGAVPEKLQQQLVEARIQFNNDVSRLGYSHGKLGSSINGMFKSMADTLGFNTAGWSSSKVAGGADKAWERASKIKGSMVERVLSKPFRIAAKHPVVAMGIGGVLAAVGIGDALQKRAERSTQQDAMNQAALIEAQMRAAQQPAYPLAQATTVHVVPQNPAPVQVIQQGALPETGSAMNPASPQIMAGNDNVKYMGTMAPQQQQLAAL